MKVLLVTPNLMGDKGKPTAPPSGFAYIASVLLKHKHEVDVCDMRVNNKWNNLARMIMKFRPDIIGIGFMSKEYLKSYELVNKIKKEFPGMKVIVGGPHASMIGKKILEECNADCAVVGEGEYTFLELCDNKIQLKFIKGLIWRIKDTIIENELRPFNDDLDSLPFPAYELWDMNSYVDKKIPIVSSRGCPAQCIYCAMKKIMGATWRFRSAENVYEEIKYFYDKGYKFFHIVDDNFTMNIERAEKICDMIIKNKLNIKFDLRNGIRVDRVSEKLLTKIKDAGCFFLAYGMEHLDNDVLKQMKKGTTREKALEAAELTKKIGIPFSAFFMIGLPGDTMEKFEEEFKLIDEMGLNEAKFSNVIPFPGTELYDMIEKNGSLLRPTEDYLNNSSKINNDPIYDYPGFSIEEKKKALKIGQNFMIKRLAKKEFGVVLGTIGYWLWQIKPLRKVLIKPASELWAFIRRRKR